MWEVIHSIANVTWWFMLAVYVYFAIIAKEIYRSAPLWCETRERSYRVKWVRRIEMASEGSWGAYYRRRVNIAYLVLALSAIPVVLDVIHLVSAYLARAFFN